MSYFEQLRGLLDDAMAWLDLRHEQGLGDAARQARSLERQLRLIARRMEQLKPPPSLRKGEPDDYPSILRLRPPGPRRIWTGFDPKLYADKLRGAFLARCAGCTLGAPVEMWSIGQMQRLAEFGGVALPPRDYWPAVASPHSLRYNVSIGRDFARGHIRHVPADDDIAYTLLGLLVLEDFGPDFTTADVGRAFVKYLPLAYVAAKAALDNLRSALSWRRAGVVRNPHQQRLGGMIRADAWGYAAPGWPEKAAELAYRDSFLSQRHNGLFAGMYWAAAISASFAVDDPLEACRIALGEIPRACRLGRELTWAIRQAPRLRDYRHARELVDRRFAGMSGGGAMNNACLVIFGLALGGRDVTAVIGNTVAMGLDNDCTAATAGSVIGAVAGAAGVPERWHRPFRNKVRTYLNGHEWFRIDDVVRRFARAAKAVRGV